MERLGRIANGSDHCLRDHTMRGAYWNHVYATEPVVNFDDRGDSDQGLGRLRRSALMQRHDDIKVFVTVTEHDFSF